MATCLAALAQVNPVVGDLQHNAAVIRTRAAEAARAGAGLVIFPELAISGYPPEDLVLKKHFVSDCMQRVHLLAKQLPPELTVIVGTPWAKSAGEPVYNAAAVISRGRVAGVYFKIALPNYGVFDEKRVFSAGERPLLVEIEGATRVGVHICEDSWLPDSPAISLLAAAQPDAVMNLSGSPYHRGKFLERQRIIGRTAAKLGCPIFYVNIVGGQDELVFDGASFAVAPDFSIMARARQFREEMLYLPLPEPRKPVAPPAPGVDRVAVRVGSTGCRSLPEVRTAPLLEDLEEIYEALKLGVSDYTDKNGFEKVIVALSGGIDSSLVASIACDALGRGRVVGITMPSAVTSSETLKDAHLLSQRLGIPLYEIPIGPLFEAYVGLLKPRWPDRTPDKTEENLQARIRGNIIMALSNKFGWLVLSTGNKSELATGYCTLYGDMVGGFAVIKDVPKMLVYDLARWRNRHGEVIPETVIKRPPSAELRPGQKDTESLPPYELLDAVLELYVEKDARAEEIILQGYEPEMVKRIIDMVDRNEYKRRQAPPGVKITPKAFGRDRRMPITNRYRTTE